MADKTYLPNHFHLAHAISIIQTLIPVIWSRFFSFRSVVLLSPIFSTAKNALPRFLQRIGPVSIFYFNLGSMVQSSTDLSSMILSKTASAPDLWNSLACFFTDNQDYRAIQLTQFLQHCRQSYIFPKPPTHLLTNPFTFTDWTKSTQRTRTSTHRRLLPTTTLPSTTQPSSQSLKRPW